MIRNISFFLSFALTLCVFGVTPGAFGAEGEATNATSGIQVSPNRFDWVLEDGETRTGVIHLHNYDDIPHDLTVEAADFFVADETFEPQFFVPEEGHERKAFDILNWIELPERDVDKPFLMPIEDVFSITGRGTVATGRIETGIANTGDPVEIIGMGAEKLTSTITGIEMFRQILDRGEAGDNAGILLRGIAKEDIKRGMVICKPGSVTPHAKFKAEVYILKKEEGGRHTPFHNNYRPQFYVRTTDVTGTINLPDGVEMVMPGDNLTITVDLIQPIALNVGLRFAIREGGRTVGAGQVTELLD